LGTGRAFKSLNASVASRREDQDGNCGQATFGELVGHVENAMTTGALPAGDADDVAQQIWSAVHGAVSLELSGCSQAPDPAATYGRLLDLIIRGLRCG